MDYTACNKNEKKKNPREIKGASGLLFPKHSDIPGNTFLKTIINL